MTSAYRLSTALLALALACGDGDGKTGASDGSTGDATHGGSTTTTTDATTGTTASTTDEPTSSGSGTGDATGTTGDTTGTDATGTTGTVAPDLERFRISRAAGPCPPDADCDGFIEVEAPNKLRVEKFGDVGNPLNEAELTDFEFSVAVSVFADPELLALLDGPEPLCDPPTDIFESMISVVDGATHEATTTACDQAPLADAREFAQALVDTYFP